MADRCSSLFSRHAVRVGPARGSCSRRVDEVTAAGLLEIVEGSDLAGHFEPVAIDRIVTALDVDPTAVPGQTPFTDDVHPVAVAEPRGAHEHELLLAEDAVLLDHFPAHRRVLAVDVEE